MLTCSVLLLLMRMSKDLLNEGHREDKDIDALFNEYIRDTDVISPGP